MGSPELVGIYQLGDARSAVSTDLEGSWLVLTRCRHAEAGE